MHTEDEAKKFYCPAYEIAAHIIGIVGEAVSKEFDVEPGNCLAGKCMMWRWAQKPNPDWKSDNGMMSTFQRDTRSDPPMYIPDKTRGYCGLAGRP